MRLDLLDIREQHPILVFDADERRVRDGAAVAREVAALPARARFRLVGMDALEPAQVSDVFRALV